MSLDLFVVDDLDVHKEIVEYIEENINEELYPGDERKIYMEAMTQYLVGFLVKLNESFKQRFAQYAHGKVLDAHGENEGIPRLQKEKATSTERFIIAQALSFNVVIPKGTRVTADNDKYFQTTGVGVIYAGSTYVDIEIEGVEGGEGYNGYTAGQLNILVDRVEYISEVRNLTATTGGDDGEPYPEEDNGDGDEHYYERIKIAKSKKSTAGAETTYRLLAMSADPGIKDAHPSTPSAGIVKIDVVVKDGVEKTQALLDKVLATCSAKKERPLGDNVTAAYITEIPYDIELTYYTTVEEESDTVAEVEGTGGSIDRFNAWQMTAAGRDINPDRLRGEILKSDEKTVGADYVAITKPVYTVVQDGQIAKFSGNITVTHSTSTPGA